MNPYRTSHPCTKEYTMNKKTLSLSLLSLALLASVPAVASARPHYDDGGRHYGYHRMASCPAADLSQEQIAQMDKFHEEHRAAVAPLYDQLMEKRLELRALSPNPNVKPEELKALSAEIASLHAKIRTINDEFYANMSKAGLPCGDYGCAWHGSRDGYGYGYGHGHCRHGCWR